MALNNLAQMMGIKTSTNADGSVNVSTTDGVNLVSNTYAQLVLFRRRPERHLWQYHHPGHQSRQRQPDRLGPARWIRICRAAR